MISVVLASAGTPDELRSCLAAIEPQRAEIGVELIVVRADSHQGMSAIAGLTTDARLVSAPQGSTRMQLRSLGLGVASGDVVALIDDMAPVPPAWLRRLSWRILGDEPPSDLASAAEQWRAQFEQDGIVFDTAKGNGAPRSRPSVPVKAPRGDLSPRAAAGA